MILERIFKRRLLPAAHRPAFERTERVLAWALTSGADAVIATNLRLWRAGIGTQWHEISKAGWDGTLLSITLSEPVEDRDGYAVVRDLPVESVELVDPHHLPHQVRLRVVGSVQHPSHHELPGGGGLWIAARRVPGVDGLSWTVRYDPGVDRDDPEVTTATEAIFAETWWRVVGPSE